MSRSPQLPAAPGIYAITCLPTGRQYVGSSSDIRRRVVKHRADLRATRHHSQKLQRAWDKYGEEAFEITTLELLESEADLLPREQHWISVCRAVAQGFNACPTAGSCRGRQVTPEHRAKLAQALVGRTRPPEHHASLVGVPKSAETRAKISAAKKGKKLAPEVVAARRGRECHPETRAKMSAAREGKPRDPAVMAKAWATRRAKAAQA